MLTEGSNMEFNFTWPLPILVALTYSSGVAGYDERVDMRFISENKNSFTEN